MIVFIISLSIYITSIMSILSKVYRMYLVAKAINFFVGVGSNIMSLILLSG